jgi:hypothetical protein
LQALLSWAFPNQQIKYLIMEQQYFFHIEQLLDATSGVSDKMTEAEAAIDETLSAHNHIQQGPDTLQELNKLLRQIQLNKFDEFSKKYLKWR